MPYFGEVSALLTALLWSFTSVAFTEASLLVGYMTVNLTRLFFALILLALTILIVGLNFHISSTQILNLFISGVIGLVFGDSFLFKAFQYIGARLSMLIMSLAPPVAAILAYLILGEKISVLGILGIIITILGISYVVLEKNPSESKFKISKIGVLYAVLGAIGQGVGLIFAKFAFNEGELNGFVATFYRIIPSVLIMYPIAKKSKNFSNPLSAFKKSPKALKFTIFGTFVGPYLGITFSLLAIAYAKIGIASTLMATIPVLMLPISRYYYKEKLSFKAIIGAFLAVIGIALLFLS